MQHSTCMRTDTIKQKLCQPRPSILICSLRNVGQSVLVVVNEPCTGSMNKPLSCRAIKSQLLRGDVKVHRERRNLLLLPLVSGFYFFHTSRWLNSLVICSDHNGWQRKRVIPSSGTIFSLSELQMALCQTDSARREKKQRMEENNLSKQLTRWHLYRAREKFLQRLLLLLFVA